MSDLLAKLIRHGDYVAIEQGRLIIRPASGKPVPDNWLDKHRYELVSAIAKRLGLSSFRYDTYTTGSYTVAGDKRCGGVTLHYINLLTDERPRITFNASLTRARTTAHGKKGSPLPRGRFRVSKGQAFVRYWCALTLQAPNRLSMFHDCMGKLSGVLISANCHENGKLDKASIEPLSVTNDQIIKAVNASYSPDKRLTTTRQVPDKYPTTP